MKRLKILWCVCYRKRGLDWSIQWFFSRCVMRCWFSFGFSSNVLWCYCRGFSGRRFTMSALVGFPELIYLYVCVSPSHAFLWIIMLLSEWVKTNLTTLTNLFRICTCYTYHRLECVSYAIWIFCDYNTFVLTELDSLQPLDTLATTVSLK